MNRSGNRMYRLSFRCLSAVIALMLLCSVGIRPAAAAGLPDTQITGVTNGLITTQAISGTATAADGGAQLDSVHLTVQRSGDSMYWDGAQWGSAPIWLTANGTSTWQYAFPENTLADGARYSIVATAVAADTTEDDIPAQCTVTYDGQAPMVAVTAPGEGSTQTVAQPTFTATATDTSLIQEVDFSYSADSGVTWTPVSTDTNGLDGYAAVWGSANLPAGNVVLKATATDLAGRTSSASSAILVDLSGPPNTNIDVGLNWHITSLQLTGTATTDPNGPVLSNVQLAVLHNGAYWDGTQWVTTDTELWFPATGTYSWSYTFPALVGNAPALVEGDGYTIRAKAIDSHVPPREDPTPASCSVIYDATDPTVDITAPVADGSVNVGQPALTAAVTDANHFVSVAFSYSTDLVTWTTISTDITRNDGYTAVWGNTVLPLGTVHLRATATDYAGHSASDEHTITVYPAPDTALTSPTVDRPVMSPMLGTTTAASGSYPVTGVELTLKRNADSKYWSGTAWGLTEVWLSASGLNAPTDFTSWIYGGAGGLVDGASYTVTARAVDANGVDPTPVVLSVVYDIAKPVISITSLSNGATAYSIKPTFTANATDTVTGVKRVEFSYSLDQGTTWTLISTDTTAGDGYTAVWGNASLPLGAVKLRAEAVDGVGYMENATIDITVSDQVPDEPDEPTAPTVPVAPTAPQSTFSAAAGGQVSGSGFTLTAPAGAVASGEGNVTITVTPLATSELPSLISSLTPPTGFTSINRAFSFSAQMISGGTSQDVHRFAQPLTLTVDLAPAELAQITDPQRVSLFRVNDDGTLTLIGGRVENGKLIVQLPTFSRYIVGCLNVTFPDLAEHWSRADVELMASKGIATGLPNGQFNPSGTVTRAEFVALLVRALGLTKADASTVSTTSFTDVKNTDWFWPEVTAAVNAGVVGGFTDGTFRPNDPVSREQAAALIARALRLCGKAGTTDEAVLRELAKAFADGSAIADWALTDVGLAANLGIVKGSDGRFAPQATATRAEAATMVARFWHR